MMSGMPLETCWAFNKFWNNKFYYKAASYWLFLLIHTTMHGSTNIKFIKGFVLFTGCTFVCRRNIPQSAKSINIFFFFPLFNMDLSRCLSYILNYLLLMAPFPYEHKDFAIPTRNSKLRHYTNTGQAGSNCAASDPCFFLFFFLFWGAPFEFCLRHQIYDLTLPEILGGPSWTVPRCILSLCLVMVMHYWKFSF